MAWRRIISREYSVQYCEIALHAIGPRAGHLLDYTMRKPVVFTEKKNQCFFFEITEEQKFLCSMVKQFSGNAARFTQFKKRFHALGKSYLAFCRKVGRRRLRNAPLKDVFIRYQKKAIDYTCLGIWIGYLLNEYWTSYGNSRLKGQEDRVIEALLRPTQKSTLLKMQERAVAIRGNKKAVHRFWGQYRWLPCLDIQNEPWSLKDAQDFVNSVDAGTNTIPMRFEDAAKKAHLNKREITTFRMIADLGTLKDLRDDYRRKAIFHARPLFLEISRRMGISIRDVGYLTEEEILTSLDGNLVDLRAAKREESFMLYFSNGKMRCIDHDIEETLKRIGFIEERTQKEEICGLVACKGRAQGIAKIVRTVHDTLKVNKGDILVAVTTHPDYLLAMQRAAAIVTDEGGMLCHAAIVSREIGVPCIVGTKNATKVIPHGSEVIADADHGTVELIGVKRQQ